MGTAAILSETLFGRTRGAVLAVLYGHIGESFYLRQLSRRTGITLGPVQREMRQLVDAGLVTKQTLGTQTLYSANQASPVFQEMRSLVAKTVGIHDALLDALSPGEPVSKFKLQRRERAICYCFRFLCSRSWSSWLRVLRVRMMRIGPFCPPVRAFGLFMRAALVRSG
jgi:DNA-binding transcriptional ArsR family regulator